MRLGISYGEQKGMSEKERLTWELIIDYTCRKRERDRLVAEAMAKMR